MSTFARLKRTNHEDEHRNTAHFSPERGRKDMSKRVCFLMESIFSIGGVQRVTAVIAKELAKDHDVTIVTFDRPDMQDTTLYGLNEANIHYRFFAYPTVQGLMQKCRKAYSFLYRKVLPQVAITHRGYVHSSFPSELRRPLIDLLNKGHYDVIIGVHAPIATRLAAIRGQLNCPNTVGWIHNSFEAMFAEGSGYAGKELERYFVYQFQRLSHTIVLSQYDAKRYEQQYGFSPEVIYNPLTLQPGKPATSNSKRFLAVGRLTPQHKGFDLLIDAFRDFARQDAEWTLDIVGEGPEEDALRRRIASYQLEDRILLHPFTNDIQAYYSKAQIYVLSSRWEGFGLVLVEAMAHGLPVISSDLPTSLELMGDFAYYFPTGNAKALADRMIEATHADWQKKSEEALKIAQRFEVSHIMSQWRKLL